MLRSCLGAAALILALAPHSQAQAPALSRSGGLAKLHRLPPPYAPDEPIIEAFSTTRSAEYLDIVARDWMKNESCGHCHANFTYMMARPLLKEAPGTALAETRKFLEGRAARFEQPRANGNFFFATEVVSTAAALAFDDARTTGKLHPATRSALDRMWRLQQGSYGGWEIEGCGKSVVPAELDSHYTAALAAIATGIAPEGYARTAAARDGLTRLRRFFYNAKPTDLHDRALVLWASGYLDGVLTTAERQTIVKELLAKQRSDGGWSLVHLAPQRRHYPRGMPTPKDPPSDAYATGFIVYVLRQAGVPASDPTIARAVTWLQSNQRASGRWFTPSSSAGQTTETQVGTRDLYILNAGTAFAIMALKACESDQ